MIGNRRTLLVVDETGGLELAEGVTEVEDERRGILVPAIFFEVNGKDMVVANGFGTCCLWFGQPAVFSCTYLALNEVINSVDGVVVPHLRLLHQVLSSESKVVFKEPNPQGRVGG